MLKEQKEQLSSLMDEQLDDSKLIDDITQDEELKQCWHRYHIVRDAVQNKLHDCSLSFDISDKVAKVIALDELFDQSTVEQTTLPKPENLFWLKTKDAFAKLSQVGLAACVTLAIIAGVQYQQGADSDTPILQTMPVGVNVAPVGGVPADQVKNQVQQETQETLDSEQYSKIRLLVQDYELQKRLNAK